VKGHSRDQILLRKKLPPDFKLGSGRPIQVVDLFCGCGGMSLGMALAVREMGRPFSVPLAIDLDASAVSVFADNLPGANVKLGSVEHYFDGALGDAVTHVERSSANRVGSPFQQDLLCP
jgi:DNA (cytosine-5)-methyltransferase 1